MIQECVPRLSNLHRAIILGLGLSAVSGWGLLAVSSQSSAEVERQLRGQVSSLQEIQTQLLSERAQTQASLSEVAQLHAQLAAAQTELVRLSQLRDQAQAGVSGKVRQFNENSDSVSETGSIKTKVIKRQQVKAVSAQKAPAQHSIGPRSADGTVRPGAQRPNQKPQRSKGLTVTSELDTAGLRRIASSAEAPTR
jgi:hypothetical protein